eukprot:8595916-Pyramimonas_sp.AAC.1
MLLQGACFVRDQCTSPLHDIYWSQQLVRSKSLEAQFFRPLLFTDVVCDSAEKSLTPRKSCETTHSFKFVCLEVACGSTILARCQAYCRGVSYHVRKQWAEELSSRVIGWLNKLLTIYHMQCPCRALGCTLAPLFDCTYLRPLPDPPPDHQS